jgi:hypothetical protein
MIGYKGGEGTRTFEFGIGGVELGLSGFENRKPRLQFLDFAVKRELS